MSLNNYAMIDFIFREQCPACVNFKGKSLSDSNLLRRNFKWCEKDILELLTAFKNDGEQHFRVRGIVYSFDNFTINEVLEFNIKNNKVYTLHYKRGLTNECLFGTTIGNTVCNSLGNHSKYKMFDDFLKENVSLQEITLAKAYPNIILFNGREYQNHLDDTRYPLPGFNLDYKTIAGVLTDENIVFTDIKEEIKKYISL